MLVKLSQGRRNGIAGKGRAPHPGQVADGGDLLLDTRRHLQPLLLHLLPQLADAVLCAYPLFLRADGARR